MKILRLIKQGKTPSRASRPPLSSEVKVEQPFRAAFASAVKARRLVASGAGHDRWFGSDRRSPASSETPPSNPYWERYLFDEAEPDRAEPALAFEFEIITGTCQVVGVVIQMPVERAPESRIPVPLETEIPPVRKLQHRAVCVGLQVQPERNIEAARAED